MPAEPRRIARVDLRGTVQTRFLSARTPCQGNQAAAKSYRRLFIFVHCCCPRATPVDGHGCPEVASGGWTVRPPAWLLLAAAGCPSPAVRHTINTAPSNLVRQSLDRTPRCAQILSIYGRCRPRLADCAILASLEAN